MLGPVAFDTEFDAACVFDELADQQFRLVAPEGGSRGLEAIPPAERARMSLKDAMIRVLALKYPCRR